MRETGEYRVVGDVKYFIPHGLPPKMPKLELSEELMELYGEATYELGRLNEIGEKLPDAERFMRAYVTKEALLSSEIEGIHTTLMEVYTSPLKDAKPSKDTQLVLNYTKALDVALKMVKDEGMPLVTRVILEAHRVLMSVGEGDKSDPGSYRQQSVRVGQMVPPLATEVPRLMGDLEKYMNEASGLPPLIRAGLVHVQFETIHPFLDGNGRIGRLLIVLMLIDSGLLNYPILYPSYYFKKYHLEYYERLDRVRTEGDFEGWMGYYLKAIRDSARDAHKRANDIDSLEMKLRKLIHEEAEFMRIQDTAQMVLEFLFRQPITTISEICKETGKAYNTISGMIEHFKKHGIVTEEGGIKRNKVFRFVQYLDLLEQDY